MVIRVSQVDPPVVAAGYRVMTVDFIGFGRSDKFREMEEYSYPMHVDTLWTFIRKLELQGLTLVMQDWGGLIGLRVAAEHPECVARLVVMNTGLPAGDMGPTPPEDTEDSENAFLRWRRFSRTVEDLPVGQLVQAATVTHLPPQVVAAYDAPFPDITYKAGARVWALARSSLCRHAWRRKRIAAPGRCSAVGRNPRWSCSLTPTP